MGGSTPLRRALWGDCNGRRAGGLWAGEGGATHALSFDAAEAAI